MQCFNVHIVVLSQSEASIQSRQGNYNMAAGEKDLDRASIIPEEDVSGPTQRGPKIHFRSSLGLAGQYQFKNLLIGALACFIAEN